MASAKMIAVSFFLVMAFFFGVSTAETYTVDWAAGVDYKAWAAAHTFRKGDTLRFKLSPDTTWVDVEKATEETFTLCQPDPKYNSLVEGEKVVLKESGMYYFINGYPNACVNGWKLQIYVLSDSEAGAAPFFPVTPPAPVISPRLPCGAAPSPHFILSIFILPLGFFIFSF